MKHLLIFCAVGVITAYGFFSAGLRVRFGFGIRYYIQAPTTQLDAIYQGWNQTEGPGGPYPMLDLYCHKSKEFCILFDDNGFIAGTQVAIRKDTFTDARLDWEIQGFTEWIIEGVTYYTLQQYFVDEQYLARHKDERRACYDNSTLLQRGRVWLTSFNGELLKISNTSEGLRQERFTEQSCVSSMGYYYYYNITNRECSSSTLLPWFPLVYDGQLIGTMFAVYGQLPEDPEQEWFERYTSDSKFAKATVPDAPKCHLDLFSDPGMLSLHIWYIAEPTQITCMFNI